LTNEIFVLKIDLEKYHMALSSLLINIFGVLTGHLSEPQAENLAIKKSLLHRARSISQHLHLLEVINKHSQDQSILNDPRKSLDFIRQIDEIQFPAEVFFEDILLNFASYYDYFAKMILLFFRNQHNRMDWRSLIKELNKKQNSQTSFFDESEIQAATVAGILKYNQERIRPLYDYRSELIHNKTDKTPGKKTSTYTQGATPSTQSKIIIGMPEIFSEASKQLIGLQIKTNHESPDIFEISRSLYIYFWNTNIQILNLLIAESNGRHRISIKELSTIVDGV